ncbi:MAG: aryl-sulfate sulfotransferase [Verrucomicrobia bacterium]|nr:aryl-sulfate sulfotransferase [Verrucomicrobiota bacterium]
MKKLGMLCLSVLAPLGAATTVTAALPADFPNLVVTGSGPVAPGSFIGTLGRPGNSPICYNVVLDNAGVPIYYNKSTVLWRAVTPCGFIAEKTNTGWDLKDESFTVKDSFNNATGGGFNGHDVDVLPNGHALIMAGEKRSVDMSQYFPGGRPDAVLDSAVIQEIDANKQIVFQWRALDHIPITDSLAVINGASVDLNHINTVALDPLDNNFLISLRTLCQIVKVSRTTGEIIWRLGGKHSDFTFIGEHPENAPYYFIGEHQMHRLINGNLLFFDNGTIQMSGTNTPTPRTYSRVIEYHLDEVNMTATLVWEYRHSPDVFSPSEGSVQRFRNGNTLIGWFSAAQQGTGPVLTEINARKEVVFELSAPGFKAQSILIKKVWNTTDLVHSDVHPGIVAGQGYAAVNSGVSVQVNSLSGPAANELIVSRHDDAVRLPKFPGKAPQVLVERVTLAGTGIDTLAADLSFDLPPNDFCFDTPLYRDPAALTIYQRATAASVFVPLPTVYDPATGKLQVSTTGLGEFIFTYPDLPEIPLPPILFGQATLGTVNQAQPVVFEWTPKGFAASYQLQVATDPGFTSPVVDQSGLTVMTYTLASVAADTPYYWRVRVSNDGGTGAWASASFRTVAPRIQVTAPNGNEGWRRGLKYFIRWNDNVAERVVIDLYQGGVFLKSLATTANAGAYEWEAELTLVPGSDYSIRISSSGNAALFDDSDAVFGIDGPVVNQAPAFSGYRLSTMVDEPLAIYPTKLLARASDADGDAVSLTRAFGPSAQGGTVALAGTVNYTPPLGFVGTDTFEVELTDARGANARGTVTITVTDAPAGMAALGQNLTDFTLHGGKAEMVFRGIPGRSYVIQRSTDMSSWSDLATVTAGADGKIPFTDPAPPLLQGFYRTQAN